MRQRPNLTEHHISVSRTARFYTTGPSDGKVERVWVVCHGYSQLASEFIKYFAPLEDGNTLVVAPEALSRFYPNRFSADKAEGRRVGASWMTREDRLTEIKDYVDYLTNLYEHLFSTIDRSKVELNVLGFSQGCATVSRWISESRKPVDRIILWAGGLPPEIDLTGGGLFNRAQLVYVVGTGDELVTEAVIQKEEIRLREHAVPYRLIRFDGGHQLHRETLLQLAAESTSERDSGAR